MLNQYKQNTINEISDLIDKVVQDDYLKVSELARFLNTLLDMKNFTAKNVNGLLISEGAMIVNDDNSIEGKYIPTEFGEIHCRKVKKDTYTYYIWKPSFILNLLNIDLSQEVNYEAFLNIQKKVDRLFYNSFFYSNIFENNMKELKNLIQGGKCNE